MALSPHVRGDTFGSKGDRARVIANRALPLLILLLTLMMVAQVKGPLSAVIPVHLLVFLAAGLLCHSELSRDRPGASTSDGVLFLAGPGRHGWSDSSSLRARRPDCVFSRDRQMPLNARTRRAAVPDRARALRVEGRRTRMALVAPVRGGLRSVPASLTAGRTGVPATLAAGGLRVLAVAAFSQARRPVSFAVTVGR